MDTFDKNPAQEDAEEYDIVVVGAGLAGLAFVLALRDAGLRIAVVDNELRIDERKLNFGYDLQPNALLALSSICLADEVKSLGALHYHWFAERLGGGTLSRWDYDMLNHSYPYAVCIRPHIIRQLLRHKVENLEDVNLFIPADFRGYRPGTTHHEVLLTTEKGDIVIRTRLLVGADGPLSRVRAAAGIKFDLHRYPYGWALTIFARSNDEVTEGYVYFGRGQYLGIVPTRAEELVIFHMTAQSSQAGYRAQFGTIEKFRREYVGMAPILQNCIENFRSWDQLSYAPSIRVRADKWIADGVALVGDAALAVNPITSQGAGLALEGGIRLATVVKHCFDRGDFSAQSLAPYEAWCRPQAESIQELGDLSAWAFSSKNRILASFNQRMLRRLESNPQMKRYILAYHSGLHWLTPGGLDWRDGLVVAGFWPNYKKTLVDSRCSDGI